MIEPRWLAEARSDIGVKELPGKADSPAIRKWLIELRAWWTDDETPWCGVAVAHWMLRTGIQPPKHWYRALAWADWGIRLGRPALGSVVVYRRAGGGHVGLVVGVDIRGQVLTLGGNQADSVNVAPFDRSRVLAYRWPPGQLADWPHLVDIDAPLMASTAPTSRNEA
jgi:uncharacterized protein (TIGR02594 family)